MTDVRRDEEDPVTDVESETRIISADDHLDLAVVPPTLWTERLPADLRDRAPRVVETDDGASWSAEGRILGLSGRRPAGLIQHADHGFRPGQPESRLEDMDRDGVWAQVIYGPPGGLPVQDPELARACERVYNDWTAEFNAAAPNRLVALPFAAGPTPEAARDELVRVAKLGHRGVVIDHMKATPAIFEPEWETFWAEAGACGLPVHLHLGGGLHTLRGVRGSWRQPAMVSVVPMQLDEMLAALVFSGTLERHSDVTVVLGESGLGWIPYVLERMDHEYHKYYDLTADVRLEMLPSELFHRQVVATYEDDELGLELVDRIGADNVMWASDYPHGDSTWPHSRNAIEQSGLGKLDPGTRRKIVWDTAARVYGIS
jgi:predicted TIM-barrel fold metal-dependent hydrolase